MTEWQAADLIRKIKEETADRYVDRHKAFDIAIRAIEKQIGIKPTKVKPCKSVSYCFCPVCNGNLSIDKDFCEECGQKIDWR